MHARAIVMGIALFTLPGCFDSDDSRRALVELRCDDGCEARWSDSDQWSLAAPEADVLAMPEVDPTGVWECDADPDVDICAEIDTHERVVCFRIEGSWVVPVAPTCAVPGSWLTVGIGMSARTID